DYAPSPTGFWGVNIVSAAPEHPAVTVPDATWANIVAGNIGDTTWTQGEVAFLCEPSTNNFTFDLAGTELHTPDFSSGLDWPVPPGTSVGLRPVIKPRSATPAGELVTVRYQCQLAHNGMRFGPLVSGLMFRLIER